METTTGKLFINNQGVVYKYSGVIHGPLLVYRHLFWPFLRTGFHDYKVTVQPLVTRQVTLETVTFGDPWPPTNNDVVLDQVRLLMWSFVTWCRHSFLDLFLTYHKTPLCVLPSSLVCNWDILSRDLLKMKSRRRGNGKGPSPKGLQNGPETVIRTETWRGILDKRWEDFTFRLTRWGNDLDYYYGTTGILLSIWEIEPYETRSTTSETFEGLKGLWPGLRLLNPKKLVDKQEERYGNMWDKGDVPYIRGKGGPFEDEYKVPRLVYRRGGTSEGTIEVRLNSGSRWHTDF